MALVLFPLKTTAAMLVIRIVNEVTDRHKGTRSSQNSPEDGALCSNTNTHDVIINLHGNFKYFFFCTTSVETTKAKSALMREIYP